MSEEHSPSSQLGLGELRDRVVGSGGEGDHAAVGGRDGEGDVGGRGVPIKGSQLLWSGTLNGRNEEKCSRSGLGDKWIKPQLPQGHCVTLL